jgi:hypothetical protein
MGLEIVLDDSWNLNGLGSKSDGLSMGTQLALWVWKHPSGTPLWHINLNMQQRRELTNLRVQEVQ